MPDLAVETPTRENGGLSAVGCVYTIPMRAHVLWDTAPPRRVTAADVIRGLKRLAIPVAGAGALHYFTSTILGMQEYCEAYTAAFRDTQPTPAALAAFQHSHDIRGLRVLDDLI